jgi:hypothetical protein
MSIKNYQELMNYLDETWFSITTKQTGNNYEVRLLRLKSYRDFLKAKKIHEGDEDSNQREYNLLTLAINTLMNRVKKDGELIDVRDIPYTDFIQLFLYLKSISTKSSTELEYNCTNNLNKKLDAGDTLNYSCNTRTAFTFKYDELEILNTDKNTDFITIEEGKVILVFYLNKKTPKLVQSFLKANDDDRMSMLFNKVSMVNKGEEREIKIADDTQDDFRDKIKKVIDSISPTNEIIFHKSLSEQPTVYWKKEIKCSNPDCDKEDVVEIFEYQFEDFFI